MSGSNSASSESAATESAAARRRRLAEVFGDDGPDQSADDLPEPGETRGRDEAWYREQTPPHHG